MGAKDMTEKTLEAMNDVFADIVNGLLFKGQPIIREEDLTDAQPFSMYKADGEIHEQERDVSKYWIAENGNHIKVRIAFLPEETINCFHSDFKVVADYFVHSRRNPDYRPTDPIKFKHVDEVLKLMSVLTRDERYVELLNQEGGKPENMCEVLDRAEERGLIKGREEGLQEGRLEGRREGIDENRLESIKNVMAGLHISAQQAMELLKIPVSEQPKFMDRL